MGHDFKAGDKNVYQSPRQKESMSIVKLDITPIYCLISDYKVLNWYVLIQALLTILHTEVKPKKLRCCHYP